MPGAQANQKLLIRFLNAGLEPKVPVVQGPYMTVVAEDGNFLAAVNTSGTVIPAAKLQYSVLLPPGKTMDAVIIPTEVGNIPVYDRRLNLTNMGVSSGGMLSYLSVQSAAPAASHPKKPKKPKKKKLFY